MNLAAQDRILNQEGGTLHLYMGEPERIYAVQHVRRMRGGSQAHLLRASDNHFYITKFQNNPQDIRILANEYLATRLAGLLGLPVPEVAIIDVPEWLIQNTRELSIDFGGGMLRPCASGLQFGSRYVADPLTTSVFDYLPETMLKRITNIDDFARVLAFDKWAGNADGRQAVYVKNPNQRRYRAWFIDQGYCFNAGQWDFPDSPLRGAFARNAVYEHVTGWKAFDPTLSQIEAITEDAFSVIADEIPPEWFKHDSQALLRLIKALYQRRLAVRGLITAFRNAGRNPFPNWTDDQNPSCQFQKETQGGITKMSDTSLKSVFKLDHETRSYKFVAHNLSAQEAVERFSNDHNAKIVDQRERHRASNLTVCKACKKAAEELTAKHTEAAGAEAEEETMSAQESESD